MRDAVLERSREELVCERMVVPIHADRTEDVERSGCLLLKTARTAIGGGFFEESPSERRLATELKGSCWRYDESGYEERFDWDLAAVEPE